MTDNRCVLQELSEPICTYAKFRYVPCSAVELDSLAGAVAIPRRVIISGTAVLLAISLEVWLGFLQARTVRGFASGRM